MLPPGALLGHQRYRIDALLAQGLISVVYQGFDLQLQRPCVIKALLDHPRLLPSDWAQYLFAGQARLLHDLSHAAIPKAFDFFAENGHRYLVLELVEGSTLTQVLEQEGHPRGLPETRVRRWAAQVCQVLAYLHGQNPPILFRNVKAGSIMVTGDDQVYLVGFSLARPSQVERQVPAVALVGGIASPEVLMGKPLPQSDLYALGALMHRVLTRHDPLNSQPTILDFPTMRSLRPDISPGFDQIIGRALQKDPLARWASASDMEHAILRLAPL